jgi:hypothetical protein
MTACKATTVMDDHATQPIQTRLSLILDHVTRTKRRHVKGFVKLYVNAARHFEFPLQTGDRQAAYIIAFNFVEPILHRF